jgi:hypothetical protein
MRRLSFKTEFKTEFLGAFYEALKKPWKNTGVLDSHRVQELAICL